MGRAFFDKSAVARGLFERADVILAQTLNGKLSDICFNGPEDRLNQTDVSQPALYVAGVASFRSAVEDGAVDPAAVTAYAGAEPRRVHGPAPDRRVLVRGRAAAGRRPRRYMQEAAVAVPSSMVAIMGADAAGDRRAVRRERRGRGARAGELQRPGPDRRQRVDGCVRARC
jgi:[acyl-carrier-protein] S-malonyltransferase